MAAVTRSILLAFIVYCDAVTYREQLDHIARRRLESRGVYPIPSRRQFNDHSLILGAPSMPSHLPEAEPILLGHTLIRPARGMLKSSIKFPHMDLDNGAGVYGNVNHLGIRYDGRNERVQYSGFRRMPEHLVVAVPKQSMTPQYSLASFLKLSNSSEEYRAKPLQRLKLPRPKRINGLIIEMPTKQFYINNKHTRTHKHRHKKVLDYESMRRDRKFDEDAKGTPLFVPNQEDSSSDYNMETASEEKKEDVSEELKSKLEWFWKTKDAYNNIKIDQEAPDLTDLMPAAAKENMRQWWFYHQDDFLPFEE